MAFVVGVSVGLSGRLTLVIAVSIVKFGVVGQGCVVVVHIHIVIGDVQVATLQGGRSITSAVEGRVLFNFGGIRRRCW